MAGAPIGNKNGAKKQRLLTDCLRRELTQKPEDVLAITRKLIESAKAGEPWAMALVHDRSDGKAPQPLTGGDDDDPPIRYQKVERVLIRADAADQDR
jgi:hypothetical protein